MVQWLWYYCTVVVIIWYYGFMESQQMEEWLWYHGCGIMESWDSGYGNMLLWFGVYGIILP